MDIIHEEILRQAIERAVKNRWKHYLFNGSDVEILFYGDAKEESFVDINIRIKNSNAAVNFNVAEQIIFSHDFARAFWPNQDWQYHLQQMVLEKDPIMYLNRFLNE